jgi:glycerophosphoryl diester phosphodiesterase
MLGQFFDLQGHRGARGLKPENTLPGFEVACDLGVTSVETDVHLTNDHVPVLFHDSQITDRLCRLLPGVVQPNLSKGIGVVLLNLAHMRGCRADKNPYPEFFADQDNTVTPVAALFAAQRHMDPYTPPTLAELFAFCDAYTGPMGKQAGKTEAQRERARRMRFDLELKRVPFRPAIMGDGFDGQGPALLERVVVEVVQEAGALERTSIRSFDHRCVTALRQLEPQLQTAILVARTAPVAPTDLAHRAGAGTYCPDVEFLDETQVRQLQTAGVRVIPWTVNHPDDWQRLLDWGVDGITTDYPDRLAAWLRERGIPF